MTDAPEDMTPEETNTDGAPEVTPQADLPVGDLPSFTEEQLALSMEFANLIGQASKASLSMLVDPAVDVKVPQLKEFPNLEELADAIGADDKVFALVEFTGDIQLPTVFFFDKTTALQIANHLMGNTDDSVSTELTDVEFSAIGEVISQMMSASANSLHQILSKAVQVTAPNVNVYSLETMFEHFPEAAQNALIMMSYPVEKSDVVTQTTIHQIFTTDTFKTQMGFFNELSSTTFDTQDAGETIKQQVGAMDPAMAAVGGDQTMVMMQGGGGAGMGANMGAGMAPNMGGQAGAAGYATPPHGAGAFMGPGGVGPNGEPVMVQPVAFPSFDNHIPSAGMLNGNLDLLMDVHLNLTVELGRSELPIKDVLELTRGSVIELSRVAGEPVDLYANGKMIAKGEVVVIEDNFGLRITSIVSPAERIKAI